jgi:hypothetical protein
MRRLNPTLGSRWLSVTRPVERPHSRPFDTLGHPVGADAGMVGPKNEVGVVAERVLVLFKLLIERSSSGRRWQVNNPVPMFIARPYAPP